MARQTHAHYFLLFGLGIIAGWFAKKVVDSPEFQRKHRHLQENWEDIKEKLADTDEAERIKEIFGTVNREVTDLYQQAITVLAQELSYLKVSLDEIDKQKYVGIVNDIVEDLRADSNISESQLNKLSKALTSDFRKLRRTRSNLRSDRA